MLWFAAFLKHFSGSLVSCRDRPLQIKNNVRVQLVYLTSRGLKPTGLSACSNIMGIFTAPRCIVRGKIMCFSFGQIFSILRLHSSNLFYRFRPSFCVLFVLWLDRLSGKEWWTSCSIQIVVIQIFVIIVKVITRKSELLIYITNYNI